MYFPIIDVLKENFIAKIPSIVTQWLTDNVNPVGSAVVVDESLSISGAAADAKVTGDKISDLSNILGYETKKIANAFPNSTGVIQESPIWDCYCYKLGAGTTINHLEVGNASEYLIYAFYDSEPNIDSQSYNSSRVFSATLYVDNLIMPNSTSWLVVRCAKTDKPIIKLTTLIELINQVQSIMA